MQNEDVNNSEIAEPDLSDIKNNNSNKTKKNKKHKWPYIVIEGVLIVVFILSAAKIEKQIVDSYRSSKADDDVTDIADKQINATIKETYERKTDGGLSVSDTDINETPETDTHTNINEFMLDMDIKSLKASNPDTFGWIYVGGPTSIKGLPINNAIMHCSDNDYYLSHTFNRSVNTHGSIFMDYRNDSTSILNNKHIIIYGHASSYKRFGGIKYLNTQSAWNLDEGVQFIKIQTENETSIWKVFSWYETNAYDDSRTTDFVNKSDFKQYCEYLQSRTTIKSLQKFEFSGDDIILTLSTCKGSDVDNRVMMHAVLISYAKIMTD